MQEACVGVAMSEETATAMKMVTDIALTVEQRFAAPPVNISSNNTVTDSSYSPGTRCAVLLAWALAGTIALTLA
jgi:hypothetical protein